MSKRPGSVPGNRREFAVAASPFNLIKLELGIILAVGVLCAIAVGLLFTSTLVQLGLLALYGLAAMGWLIVRTRQVLKTHTPSDPPHGPQ